MSEDKDTDDPSIGKLKNDTGKEWKWSIKFDKHLKEHLLAQSIEDPEEQQLVCDALCALGLANYRLFGEDTDTLDSDEHTYTSTKAMRKLAREYLDSTKHWRFPG